MLSPLLVGSVREASRRLVRELGFMRGTLAGTALPPSAVHALVEIAARGPLTAAALGDLLILEKSSVSRMLRKLVDGGDLAEQSSSADRRAKLLSLTPHGRMTVEAIDRFARGQVGAALGGMPAKMHQSVATVLSAYAAALARHRVGEAAPSSPIEICPGYRAGVIGRVAEMHGRTYARLAGFGSLFEGQVATEIASFVQQLARPANRLWVARQDDAIVGTIVIDGEDLGPGVGHLRWFIVDEAARGAGVGRRLLLEAVRFCDGAGFSTTQLWTFRGLDAARTLYEANGFRLAEEWPGRRWGAEVMEQRFERPGAPAKLD